MAKKKTKSMLVFISVIFILGFLLYFGAKQGWTFSQGEVANCEEIYKPIISCSTESDCETALHNEGATDIDMATFNSRASFICKYNKCVARLRTC